MQPLKRQYMANVNNTDQHLFIILFQEYVHMIHVSTSQNLFCVFQFFHWKNSNVYIGKSKNKSEWSELFPLNTSIIWSIM